MNPVDVLLTICESAIVVVGFAAIALAVRPSAFQRGATLSAFRLRLMIESAAGAIAISFFPTLLFALELGRPTVWRISSGLLASATLGYVVSIFVRQHRLLESVFLPQTRTFDIGVILLTVLVVGLLVLNCSVASPGSAAYLAGALFWLTGAIVEFVRLVFFPVADE